MKWSWGTSIINYIDEPSFFDNLDVNGLNYLRPLASIGPVNSIKIRVTSWHERINVKINQNFVVVAIVGSRIVVKHCGRDVAA